MDAEAYKEVTVDPNSQLVELVPGGNDDVVDITVPAGGGEEHVQADTVSEDDISALGENKHRKRSRSKAKKRDHMVSEAKAPKLRPAGGMNSVWETSNLDFANHFAIDVLSRIQWDPAYRSEDFVIGYLERFEGIKEMPLDLWLKESTEEDFIPQHRIKYFKKTPSEEVVWSRDDRIDKVFGSGLGSGGSDKEQCRH